MLDDHRVVDGNVPGALVEIRHRVPASLHHLAEQRIGKGDRARRIVDEPPLHLRPAIDEVAALGCVERTDVEFLDALLALGELRFGFRAAGLFLYRAIIFRTELVPEMIRATAP